MIVCLQVGITTYAQSPNPIVKRLSQTEISQCSTPSRIQLHLQVKFA